MRTIHSFRLLVASSAIFSLAQFASAQDYFPLQVGNSWLYKLTSGRGGGDTRSISVEGVEKIGDRDYFKVNWFGRQVSLRTLPDAAIVVYDRASSTEKPWLWLTLPQGSTFATTMDQCTETGTVESRQARVDTPAGSFTDVVQVRYQGRCADAGVTQQSFAPNVGLAVHEETSFAGPRRYELTYYRVGSTSGSSKELSFTVALDAAKYPAGGELTARLTLRNTTPNPITLHFPSGQSFDLKIINENGEIGYTWSADKLFVAILRDEQVGPGERTYGVTAPLGLLPPGRYKVQAFLTTQPIEYLGETGFEIIP